jgi:hypothetical protein
MAYVDRAAFEILGYIIIALRHLAEHFLQIPLMNSARDPPRVLCSFTAV